MQIYYWNALIKSHDSQIWMKMRMQNCNHIKKWYLNYTSIQAWTWTNHTTRVAKMHSGKLNEKHNKTNFVQNPLVYDLYLFYVLFQELKESFNYGLFCPPSNGKAGKFLDEERRLGDYPFNGPVGYLEVGYGQQQHKSNQFTNHYFTYWNEALNVYTTMCSRIIFVFFQIDFIFITHRFFLFFLHVIHVISSWSTSDAFTKCSI